MRDQAIRKIKASADMYDCQVDIVKAGEATEFKPDQEAIELASVSYTHLDVYKRQANYDADVLAVQCSQPSVVLTQLRGEDIALFVVSEGVGPDHHLVRLVRCV